MTEFSQKQDRIFTLLDERKLDALVLQKVSSFAWATCGAASYVNTASTDGTATLLITPSGLHLITTNIEAVRMEKEEHLKVQGWEFHVHRWHTAQEVIPSLTRGMKIGADGPYPGATDLSGELARLRANLTPEEGIRFRELAGICAEAMDKTIRMAKPGETEYQIAGRLAWEAESRGAQAIVNLIATDERIFTFRHPLPTSKRMERYAMLVLCGRRWGLVCSITRLVHFGPLPGELHRKSEAVALIDAAFIDSTRPGLTLGEVFKRAQWAYAETGFGSEWSLHHQGGPAGYEPREYIATPGSTDEVHIGQTYAWNPSITGVKSEDTILVGQAENEVLTTIAGWPMIHTTYNGKAYLRPAILEVA